MIITCPNCDREYRLEDSRIPVEGITARCSGCGHRFRVSPVQPGGGIECPKCGHRQMAGEECTRCGVIFGKIPASGVVVDLPGNELDTARERPPGSTSIPASSPLETSFGSPSAGVSSAPQGPPGFSIGEAVGFGWNKAKENLGTFLVLLIAGAILIIVPSVLTDLAEQHAPAISIVLFRIVAVVLESAVTMGFIKVCLKVCDGEKPEVGDLLNCLPLFFKYFFASLLYGLIVLAGFLLLVVPGIIWSIRFVFYGYFIVDKGQGPIEALKSSSAITKGVKSDLFLLGMCLVGVNLLGILALGVGLFVTIPLSMLAFAHAFRQLEGRLDPGR